MSETVIGSSMVVDGEITGEEDLIIQGTVKGKIAVKNALQVGDSAVVEANVQASVLTISGQLKGNVQASDRLEVTSEGRLVGDVKTPRILIADGAAFRGKVEMDVS